MKKHPLSYDYKNPVSKLNLLYEKYNEEVNEIIKDMSPIEKEIYINSDENQEKIKNLRMLENYLRIDDAYYHMISRNVKKKRGLKE